VSLEDDDVSELDGDTDRPGEETEGDRVLHNDSSLDRGLPSWSFMKRERSREEPEEEPKVEHMSFVPLVRFDRSLVKALKTMRLPLFPCTFVGVVLHQTESSLILGLTRPSAWDRFLMPGEVGLLAGHTIPDKAPGKRPFLLGVCGEGERDILLVKSTLGSRGDRHPHHGDFATTFFSHCSGVDGPSKFLSVFLGEMKSFLGEGIRKSAFLGETKFISPCPEGCRYCDNPPRPSPIPRPGISWSGSGLGPWLGVITMEVDVSSPGVTASKEGMLHKEPTCAAVSVM